MGVDAIYDFTVPYYHNYIAGGVVNHNTGKNHCAAAEVAIHATGLYPGWWDGRRFGYPVEVLCSSISHRFMRDGMQKDLLGPIEMVNGKRQCTGSGWIPPDRICDMQFKSCGVQNVVDTVTVRHENGGFSVIYFLPYEAGTNKFQGFRRDVAWLDEEPDQSIDQRGIFSEVQTRMVAKKGIILFTRTPLYGMTPMVKHFYEGTVGTYTQTATWDDAIFLDEDTKARLKASYPDHEVEARTKGVPMMGEGAIYPVPDEDILIDPFPIPDHYRRICGLDFGWDHPTAAVWLALDADSDVAYIYDCYKKQKEIPAAHREAIIRRGDWIPVAWPHDGMNAEKSSGQPLIETFNLPNALPLTARYDDEKGGRQDNEPVIMNILQRMRTGRLKVFSNCTEWMNEKRMYHRKEGKINQSGDDLMSATNYAFMMIRYARAHAETGIRQTRTIRKRSPLDQFIGSR